MLSLFAVLSLIVGISVAISYSHVVTEADEILGVLADNDGHGKQGKKRSLSGGAPL